MPPVSTDSYPYTNTANDVLPHAVGATIESVAYDPKEPRLTVETDRGTLSFWHSQECCESVDLTEGLSDLEDLVGGVIALAEERSSEGVPAMDESDDRYGTFTWTFYEIQTTKGDATLRWYGTSNGYYSESVDVSWTDRA